MAALVLSKCAHRVFKMCKRERTPKRCSCFMSAPPGQERVAFRVTHFSLMISHAIADEFQGVFSNVWFSQTYPDKHSRREKSVWGGRLPLGGWLLEGRVLRKPILCLRDMIITVSLNVKPLRLWSYSQDPLCGEAFMKWFVLLVILARDEVPKSMS